MVKEKQRKKSFQKLFITMSSLLLIPVVSFSSQFIVSKQDISTKKNELMGVIYKGTKIEKKGNLYNLSGWVMDGNEYIIFYSKDERIKLARIDESFIKNQKIQTTVKDEFGVVWKNINLEVKLKDSKKLTNKKDSLWVEEDSLYQRCGTCHNLHDVKEFTANQWPQIMKTMQNNAGFTKNEAKNVSVFLQYKSIQEK